MTTVFGSLLRQNFRCGRMCGSRAELAWCGARQRFALPVKRCWTVFSARELYHSLRAFLFARLPHWPPLGEGGGESLRFSSS